MYQKPPETSGGFLFVDSGYKSGIRKKLQMEIERHKKFHSGIMGKSEVDYTVKDADIRNYAKYLLTEGSMFEKRDLLICLKSEIELKDKKIDLN